MYGVAFVEQAFFVKLLEEVPEGFDVVGIKGDVRIFQVHPIADLLGELVPLILEAHHRFPALFIVLCYGDFLPNVFLGDA